MLQTIEATIDEKGNVRLLEPIQLPEPAARVCNDSPQGIRDFGGLHC